MISQMKALEDENRRLKKMYAEMSIQAELLKEALGKNTRPFQRREMAGKAVASRGVSIALACRTFEASETCYRYSAKLNDENEH
ncbi:transposase [Pseudorhizobium halotolerans]|uniref:Transposase n=1 Tax=Pseudorhizobium halotolerans TaxID=1233081 RepID=A0ABN7JG60_9HYPH|nr:transposase [Pseudorhizobium halotolerans]